MSLRTVLSGRSSRSPVVTLHCRTARVERFSSRQGLLLARAGAGTPEGTPFGAGEPARPLDPTDNAGTPENKGRSQMRRKGLRASLALVIAVVALAALTSGA